MDKEILQPKQRKKSYRRFHDEERMTLGNVRQACHQFSSNNVNLYSTPQQQPKPTPPPKPTQLSNPKLSHVNNGLNPQGQL